jgi:metal-sulfur cluster biosynthetic enzyme
MTTALNETMALDALRQVIDPEIGCNIVDLGLVYDVQIAGDTVRVRMTLTTPGCPMSESIGWGVKQALLNLEPVMDAEVELVWEPRWNPDMASDHGRECLGLQPR